MIKKILFLFVILIVAGAALVFIFGSSALNKGIKTGVETFGPKMTQTPVTLEAVNISVFSGTGTLKGLNVGNPEGFKSENIFALGQIDIDIDKKSVLTDTIVINKIHIKQPEISYEKTLSKSNIKELQKSIEAFTGAGSDDAPAEDSADEGAGKQLVISKLIIEDAKVYVGLMGAGMEVPLPRIEMDDIGKDGNKKSISQVLDLVLTEVVKAIGPAIAGAGGMLKDGGQAILDTAQDKVLDNAGDAAADTVNKATEGLKGLFGK